MDLDLVTLLCESADERQVLRLAVLRAGTSQERAGLRALDAQIAGLLAALALNPAERRHLKAGGEAPHGKLAALRAARHT